MDPANCGLVASNDVAPPLRQTDHYHEGSVVPYETSLLSGALCRIGRSGFHTVQKRASPARKVRWWHYDRNRFHDCGHSGVFRDFRRAGDHFRQQ